jgi:very-short-patch-repair endonuclease
MNADNNESANSDEIILADVALPEDVQGHSKRRVELVRQAVKEWIRQLIDLGGRNNLLHYRDLKQGTLDLTAAQPKALEALLRNKTAKMSSLFPDADAREQVLRRVRTIHKKAKENFEERGIDTLSLGCGLATWENKNRTWEARAPVLLRHASLRPLGAAQDEFELSLLDEMEVNQTLLHFLKVDFDCTFDQDALLNRVDGVIDETWELEETYKWMKEHAKRVPNFNVEPRLVLANFAYAKLPMVKDLENAFEELVAHDLIAAIAGDEDAREKSRSECPGADAIPSPNHMPLADEFLVLDADSSQEYAINAVIAGASLIVKGPPGTGKSQTIANLVGSLVAHGKKVLFVAEKRAAIDAVLKRLHQQKLGDLVLDLHGGVSSRRAFAQAIGRALATSRTAPKIDNEAAIRRLENRREQLNRYLIALHEKRQPWDVSVYNVSAELLSLDVDRNETRFRGDVLERRDAKAEDRVEEDLAEYARLGGLTLSSNGSPWVNSSIDSDEQVRRAHALVDDLLRHTLPTTLAAVNQTSTASGLPSAATLNDWAVRLKLLDDVRETLRFFRRAIYDQDLDLFCGRLAPAAIGSLTRLKASVLSGDYKRAREAVRAFRADDKKTTDLELLQRCEVARKQLRQWQSLGGETTPALPSDAADARAPYEHLLGQINELEGWTGANGIGDRSAAELEVLLRQLLEDRATLVKLPELHRLERSLVSAGLAEFLTGMKARQVSEEFCVRSFRYAWLQSILEHVSIADPIIGRFVPESHQKAIEDFKGGDHAHIETTPARISRICAEQAIVAREAHKDQDAIVRRQAGLKSRHRPVRELVPETSDVLLALKPCWAMSPLVVSQLLPAKALFDVVIFDEASQITPADAISSILRGKQLVVAGDQNQLPPTAFFLAGASDDEDDEEDELEALSSQTLMTGTKGFESILDALGWLIKFRMLTWHYRSQDERLIAFSNAHIYDRGLTTFPGIGGEQVLHHVTVPWMASAETNSPSPEVEAVVELILDHARERANESLGVIAMGIKHANRIEESLRLRLSKSPDLEEEVSDFFDESREERFFVKNLERVQGDERDAIILSIGYGKNARGVLPYHFGPLLGDGGERRLNVAVTRAKKRITLVSSFSSNDMDPERSDAAGVKLLRQYLQYIESDGTNLGDRVLEKPILNPFEVDVRDTLSRRGLKLKAQYGSSGYWIDFAVQHPTQPGRYIMAIECDGASYHSSDSARDRDRLRQEQLERLGWRFCRIWSSEWFYNKERAVDKVMAAYEEATRNGEPKNLDLQITQAKAAALLSQTTAADQPPPRGQRSGTRPTVYRGLPIQSYRQGQLVALARWIESDELLRTADDLLVEMMRELGITRRGKHVVAGIRAAIEQARRPLNG